MESATDQLLLTPLDVAARLGVDRQVVYRMLSGGDLPSVNVSSGERQARYRVSGEALVAFLAGRTMGSAR